MALIARKIVENARLPTCTGENYCFYCAEDTTIPSKGAALVKTGISLVIPREFYVLLVSANIAISNRIIADAVVGVHYENKNEEVMIHLTNHGDAEFTATSGLCIANFVLVQTALFPISGRIPEEVSKMQIIPKTPGIWFKENYMNDPAKAISDFKIPPDVLASTEEFKRTSIYAVSQNQKAVEANFVWKSLSDDVKKTIRTIYYALQDEKIGAPLEVTTVATGPDGATITVANIMRPGRAPPSNPE